MIIMDSEVSVNFQHVSAEIGGFLPCKDLTNLLSTLKLPVIEILDFNIASVHTRQIYAENWDRDFLLD
jgi:hypothetical protein